MSGELMLLGAAVCEADISTAASAEQLAVDQGIRASLLCALLGVEREEWIWPFPALAARAGLGASGPTKMLAGLFDVLGGIGHLGTLAGAADLDPMDPGPSHTVLPATLASCIAANLVADSRRSDHDDPEVASGVLAGIDAGWRLRRAVSGTRPGVGFHSPGVFGTVAAAAAAARTLRLDEQQCADAVAIALTRASGLAINSAASMIGMTHFGWGAAHGLEAALLASEGWGGSHDVEKALSSLFGQGRIDLTAIMQDVGPPAVAGLVFKRYPCNIYLNLVALMLDEVKEPVDRVQVTMPWIPHLDCPQPRDIRQARNSAQAVAAIAGRGDTSYGAFSGPPGPWLPKPEVSRLMENIELVVDREAPTRLGEAVVEVRAWTGRSLVQDSSRAVRDMRGWGVEHARKLMGPGDALEGVEALYGGSFLAGFGHLNRRRLARMA